MKITSSKANTTISNTTASSAAAFRLGLVVNPLAGLGGPAGLKGSDHIDTAEIAAQRGVQSKVAERVSVMLLALVGSEQRVHIITASGAMGASTCDGFADNISYQSVYDAPTKTRSVDTCNATKNIVEQNVDLLVFAGGDGTARDIYDVVGESQTVLGLPAGVKMHSGVFAVTPKAMVSVITSMVERKLVAARMAEVRDIDERAFSEGRVKTQYFGEMMIPDDQLLVQCVKCSGLIDDELLLDELVAYLVEELDEDFLYILGSGGTLKALKDAMAIEEPTLLGVDVWYQGELLVRDAHESALFELIQHYPKVRIILSVIGGQGVILGRGNQQVSPRIIEYAGLENLQFVSTQNKIKALQGRPLRVDSGSDELDRKLAGFHKIICGYEDALLYEISYSE